MTIRVLIVGGTSGIGLACCDQLTKNSNYETVCWGSLDLDLNYPRRIFETDLSSFDIVLNCAAHSQGTYQGFLKNSWENQLSQITVNYTSNLFLLKHYANSRRTGKYVWCSTVLTQGVTPYKSVYLSTKIASQFAFELIQQEVEHISIVEAQFGAVETNFRYRNFLGTLTQEQVCKTYNDGVPLKPDYVAEKIISAIENDLEKVLIE